MLRSRGGHLARLRSVMSNRVRLISMTYRKHSPPGVRPHECTWPRRLAEQADSRPQSRFCIEWLLDTGLYKARPPGAAARLSRLDGGVGPGSKAEIRYNSSDQ